MRSAECRLPPQGVALTGDAPASNPFATCWIRSGAIPFRFANNDQQRFESLARDWQRHSGFGQIVGPHGVGKSTLAKRLIESQRSSFGEVEFLVLRRSKSNSKWRQLLGIPCEIVSHHQSDSPVDPTSIQTPDSFANSGASQRLLVIDGLECLSLWMQLTVALSCRRAGCAVLLTTHHAIPGVPILHRLQPDPDHFVQLANGLIRRAHDRGWRGRVPPRTEILSVYQSNDGNYRDAFLTLYDLV